MRINTEQSILYVLRLIPSKYNLEVHVGHSGQYFADLCSLRDIHLCGGQTAAFIVSLSHAV
jgi:hypothetical protein